MKERFVNHPSNCNRSSFLNKMPQSGLLQELSICNIKANLRTRSTASKYQKIDPLLLFFSWLLCKVWIPTTLPPPPDIQVKIWELVRKFKVVFFFFILKNPNVWHRSDGRVNSAPKWNRDNLCHSLGHAMTVILYSAEHWDNSYRFLLWHLSKKKC